MRLSTKGRYAVMAMVDLAQHSAGDPISLAEIADRQEISLSYLEQLFAMLRKGGLVKSVRGPGGGYLLAHDRSETRIADIILAIRSTSISARSHSPMYASGVCSGAAVASIARLLAAPPQRERDERGRSGAP